MTKSVTDALLAELLDQVEVDPWRRMTPFTEDLEAANNVILEAPDKATVIHHLNQWIGKHQPCIFGRLAARSAAIRYCIVTESDIRAGDARVANQIEQDRASWKAEALTGSTSAFILAVVSERFALARPSAPVAAFASRLLKLFLLLDTVERDRIYVDDVELEIPGQAGSRSALVFDVGINYFSAQGDGRWWHDHRMPIAMAFSTNSVGHLVASRRLTNALSGLRQDLLREHNGSPELKLDSLHDALLMAMRTIRSAQATESGPATRLCPSGAVANCPSPQAEIPPDMAPFSHCEYEGYYHTDVTLPSDYFRPDVGRAPSSVSMRLDFTYLFDERLDNVAFARMGRGVRIRTLSPIVRDDSTQDVAAILKRRKAFGRPPV